MSHTLALELLLSPLPLPVHVDAPLLISNIALQSLEGPSRITLPTLHLIFETADLHVVRQEVSHHTIPILGRKPVGKGLGGAALFRSELVKSGASRGLEMILLQCHHLSVK